jgi:hypothetical protein
MESRGLTWTQARDWAIRKFPVKLQLSEQWMPVHPDTFGLMWNVQVQVVPVHTKADQEKSYPRPRSTIVDPNTTKGE